MPLEFTRILNATPNVERFQTLNKYNLSVLGQLRTCVATIQLQLNALFRNRQNVAMHATDKLYHNYMGGGLMVQVVCV